MEAINKRTTGMRAIGIVRRLDQLGRVVIPIETRRILKLEEKDAVEIYVSEEGIMLKKYEPSCVFCGEVSGVISKKGKNICPSCLEGIKNMKMAT